MRWDPRLPRIGAFFVAWTLLASCGEEDVAPVDQPAEIETQAVADALPAGAIVVVSGYQLQEFWSRLEATQLYSDLSAIEGVQQAFSPISETQMDFESKTGIPLNEETLMVLLGGKFDIGYYGSLPDDNADVLLVSEVTDVQRAQEIVNAVETRLQADEGATFSEREIGGTTVRVGTDDEGNEVLFYALEDDRLTMGTTEARLQAALGIEEDDQMEPMSEVEEYVAALSKLPEATISVYVDQHAVRDAARMAAAEDTTMPRERLGAATAALEEYNPVRASAWGIYWTETGIRSDVYALFDEGEKAGIVEMLSRSPSAIRTLSFQPVGALLYGAVNSFDAGLVYEELTSYAVDATRIQAGVEGTVDSLQADSVVASEIAQFERQTGIDIEEDILSWVGEEISFAIAGIDRSGFFPIPETALTIATKDSERARAFLAEAEQLISEAAQARASIPLAWRSGEHQGQTIRFAPTPLGEGLTLAYTVTDDFVIIASSQGLVQRMLDARAGQDPSGERAEALPSNPDFGAMTEFYPEEVNAIGFINLEQILTQVQDLMNTYGMGSGAAIDSTSTAGQVMAAMRNAPRLGFYSTADGEGVFGHLLLEVQ